MNFLSKKTAWTNAELGLLKICLASIYIIVGAYFHEFVREWWIVFLAVFLTTVAWVFALWLKKMKE